MAGLHGLWARRGRGRRRTDGRRALLRLAKGARDRSEPTLGYGMFFVLLQGHFVWIWHEGQRLRKEPRYEIGLF